MGFLLIYGIVLLVYWIFKNSTKTAWGCLGGFANVQGNPIFSKKFSQNDIIRQVSSRIIIYSLIKRSLRNEERTS